jgi:hypothetical protein
MLRRVVWYKFADVSEVLIVSIIRAMVFRLHGVILQNTAILIFAAVET